MSENLLSIREDDLSTSAARNLLRLHLEGMHAHSPPSSVFALDFSGLSAPNVTVWTVWRRDVAATLLGHIIEVAQTRGMVRLSLETGSGPYFEPALSLYRRRGFIDGEEFAGYKRSAFNQFLHLVL